MLGNVTGIAYTVYAQALYRSLILVSSGYGVHQIVLDTYLTPGTFAVKNEYTVTIFGYPYSLLKYSLLVQVSSYTEKSRGNAIFILIKINIYIIYIQLLIVF